MIVADGYMTQYSTERMMVRLSLVKGDCEISTIMFDEAELELLIEKLRDTMRKAKEPPRRRPHSGRLGG